MSEMPPPADGYGPPPVPPAKPSGRRLNWWQTSILVLVGVSLSVLVRDAIQSRTDAAKNQSFESKYNPDYGAYDTDLPQYLGTEFMSHIGDVPSFLTASHEMGDRLCQARYEKVSETEVEATFFRSLLSATPDMTADQIQTLYNGVYSASLADLCPGGGLAQAGPWRNEGHAARADRGMCGWLLLR
jgi:hypothetical protein